MIKKISFLLLLLATMVVTSCISEDSVQPREGNEKRGLYLLSGGMWNQANGELAFYNYNEGTNTYEADPTKRIANLGETPNDMIKYGSKLYVAIAGTQGAKKSYIKVYDLASGKEITSIDLNKTERDDMPRQLLGHGKYVYATLYDGHLLRLDTATLVHELTPVQGKFSEGIALSGNELFICNSRNDKTISVVDVAQFKETSTIQLEVKPNQIVSDGKGGLYFSSSTEYSADWSQILTPSDVHKLDATSKQVTKTLGLRAGAIAKAGDYLIITNLENWSTGESTIKKLSLADGSVTDFTTYAMPSVMKCSGVSGYDAKHQELFLKESAGQRLYRYTLSGKLLQVITAEGKDHNATVVL